MSKEEMHDLEVPDNTILDEAKQLIHGKRQKDYGPPQDDFKRTGRIWGALLGIDDIPPEKVALCMIAVKLSRQCHKPSRDNIVDIAGYAGTVEMIEKCAAELAELLARGTVVPGSGCTNSSLLGGLGFGGFVR